MLDPWVLHQKTSHHAKKLMIFPVCPKWWLAQGWRRLSVIFAIEGWALKLHKGSKGQLKVKARDHDWEENSTISECSHPCLLASEMNWCLYARVKAMFGWKDKGFTQRSVNKQICQIAHHTSTQCAHGSQAWRWLAPPQKRLALLCRIWRAEM